MVYCLLFKNSVCSSFAFFSWVHMLVFTTDIFFNRNEQKFEVTDVWVELPLTFSCRLTLVFLGFLFNWSDTCTVAEFCCCLWALRIFLSCIPGDQFCLDFHSHTPFLCSVLKCSHARRVGSPCGVTRVSRRTCLPLEPGRADPLGPLGMVSMGAVTWMVTAQELWGWDSHGKAPACSWRCSCPDPALFPITRKCTQVGVVSAFIVKNLS